MTQRMSLEEFLAAAEREQQRRRDAGQVTLYVRHETLTPGNVRATFADVPVGLVPEIGTVLHIPGAGYDSADARWRVTGHEWLNRAGVILTCDDAP